jgi:hypothetical protein
MGETRWRTVWLPRLGWVLVAVLAVAFLWGLHRRATLQVSGQRAVQMLFVPSVEQGTLVRRGDELARFVRQDSGLTLRSQVPTSYAAVIQALGAGQADVAWIPAFAYVVANARFGAEARLQVVRAVERYAIVVTRSAAGEPDRLEDLVDRRVAFPQTVRGRLRAAMVARLDELAPGWVEVPVSDDKTAIWTLVERRGGGAAAHTTSSGTGARSSSTTVPARSKRPGSSRPRSTPSTSSRPSTTAAS